MSSCGYTIIICNLILKGIKILKTELVPIVVLFSLICAIIGKLSDYPRYVLNILSDYTRYILSILSDYTRYILSILSDYPLYILSIFSAGVHSFKQETSSYSRCILIIFTVGVHSFKQETSSYSRCIHIHSQLVFTVTLLCNAF